MGKGKAKGKGKGKGKGNAKRGPIPTGTWLHMGQPLQPKELVILSRCSDGPQGTGHVGPLRVVGLADGSISLMKEDQHGILRITERGNVNWGGRPGGVWTRFFSTNVGIVEGTEIALLAIMSKLWLSINLDGSLGSSSERQSLVCEWVQTHIPGVPLEDLTEEEEQKEEQEQDASKKKQAAVEDVTGLEEPPMHDVPQSLELEEGMPSVIDGEKEVDEESLSSHDYWKQELSNLPVFELKNPPLHPMDAYMRQEVGLVSGSLAPTAFESAKEVPTRLLAVWAALLCRYTRSDEVVVGVEILEQHSSSIGPLVIRLPFSDDWPVHLLEDAASVRLRSAKDHSAELAQSLAEGLQGDSHIFRVGFVCGSEALLHGSSRAPEKLKQFLLPRWAEVSVAKIGPLLVQLRCSPSSTGGAELQLLYDVGTLQEPAAQRLLQHLGSLLCGVGPCAAVALSNQEESSRLLRWSDATSETYEKPAARCIQEAFLEHAAVCPEAVALIGEDASMSYGQLAGAAFLVAGRLSDAKVEADMLVPLMAPRGFEMIAGMFGILVAGAGYLPLDQKWPDERIVDVCSQVTVKAACAGPGCTQRLACVAAIVVDLSRCVLSADNVQLTRARFEVASAQQVAGGRGSVYCFFTSGSTGKPKGIVVEHRGLVHRIMWFQKQWSLGSGESVMLKHSYTFGLSEWEIFWPLSSGATLLLCKAEGEKDVEYLWNLSDEHRLRTQVFVPSVLRALLEYGELEQQEQGPVWPHLRHIITCGEPLSAELAQHVFDMLPQVTLTNLYGPTEGEMTVWQAPRGEIFSLVPIGVPMGGSRVLLRTPGGSLTALGEPGEIHFGGQFIARGYLGLPELTAAKFVPDTHEGNRGYRLYATGDLARWRESGVLDFIGRADFQVKIRGFRIELGDIEEALRGGGAKEAVCIVAGEELQQRLVAYAAPSTVDVAELRAACVRRLPPYMVPTQIVILSALPRTSSGKVDRRSLPPPPQPSAAEEGTDSTLAIILPRNELETRVKSIWVEVLKLDPSTLSVEADWPTVGGNSLLAGRATSMLRKALGVQLPGTAMYTHSTIAKLAELARKLGAAESRGIEGVEALQDHPTKLVSAEDNYRGLNPRRPLALFVQLFIAVFACAIGDTGSTAIRLGLAWQIYKRYGVRVMLSTMPILIALCLLLEVLLCVMLKWIVVGKLVTGRYPLWGCTYFKWLINRHLVEKTRERVAEIVSGTVLFNIYYRALGASIGTRVCINDPELEEPDLVRIGDDVEINQPRFGTAAIVHGELILSSVIIGARCRTLPRAMLSAGTVLPDGSEVPAMASTAGEAGRAGAFCELQESGITRLHTQDTLRICVGVPLLLCWHGLALGISLLALHVVWHIVGRRWLLFGAVAPLIFRHCNAATFFALTVLQKRLIVGRLLPGPLPQTGTWRWHWDVFREWLHEQAVCAKAFDDAVDPLVGSEFLSMMYRMLGTTVGRRVQIDNFHIAEHDCVTIDDDVVFGSAISIYCTGRSGRAPVRFHRGSNVLDHCVVLPGARIGERAVLGSATIAPENGYFPPESISTGQVGGKPVRLRFQATTEEQQAVEWEAMRRLNSASWFWGFNLLLAASAFLASPVPQYVGLATYLLYEWCSAALGLYAAAAVLPFLFFSLNMCMLTANWAIKWCLVGRYLEGDYAFFGRYHSTWMGMLCLAGVLEEAVDALGGTEFLVWYYRAMGAKVGHSCCLFGLAFEYDLLTVGECSSIGWECDTTCHTVENMVIKLAPTILEAYTSVLPHSMVSPGASMGRGALLLENSQVLKGEEVPADEVWAGLPAALCGGAELRDRLRGIVPVVAETPTETVPVTEAHKVGERALEEGAVISFDNSTGKQFMVEKLRNGSVCFWTLQADGKALLKRGGHLRFQEKTADYRGGRGKWAQFKVIPGEEFDEGAVLLQGVGTRLFVQVDAQGELIGVQHPKPIFVRQTHPPGWVTVEAEDYRRRLEQEAELYFQEQRQQAAYALQVARQLHRQAREAQRAWRVQRSACGR